jgi:hypothetical protein
VRQPLRAAPTAPARRRPTRYFLTESAQRGCSACTRPTRAIVNRSPA